MHSENLRERRSPFGRTLVWRAAFLALEFTIIFGIYYVYGLISGADIPLYVLTALLIIADRSVDAVRQSFEKRQNQKEDRS